VNLLLPDTHLLLCAVGLPDKLSAEARDLIEDSGNMLAFSAASLWEIVIKSGLGRGDFQIEPRRLQRGLLDAGYHEIVVTGEHVLGARRLPPLHKDPFDRILIAQADVEGAVLLTADQIVAQYPGSIRAV
jgi:PIN domain nuclease of toxin-antitoxin system